jgi:hypothetical protein
MKIGSTLAQVQLDLLLAHETGARRGPGQGDVAVATHQADRQCTQSSRTRKQRRAERLEPGVHGEGEGDAIRHLPRMRDEVTPHSPHRTDRHEDEAEHRDPGHRVWVLRHEAPSIAPQQRGADTGSAYDQK